MTTDEFEREVEMAGEGRWDELGLDDPSTWQSASIEELRDAA